ncbi:MAG: tRNA pseudouridine(55) synthase, partial [Flavobacteriales bacterium]|nr:tRNA pseudouridine(55) synthase [Flavobacteriales bacterium]
YSAKWVNGERAYKKAHKGEMIDAGTKSIEILSFIVEKIEMPNVFFRIECSKGTYIRSIANDFGEKLKSGSHLTSLCRTAINKSKLEDAISVQTFESMLDKQFPEIEAE